MKGNRLLMMVIGVFFCSPLFAQVNNNLNEKVIYKWEDQGLIYYSHIKPAGIKDYVKLDSRGRKVEDFSEEFDEIVEIAVRPNKAGQSNGEVGEDLGSVQKVAGSAEVEAEVEADREEKVREKNCETAQKNLAIIKKGEVYEPDSKGNMIRLSFEQVESKRSNVLKDIDYFCDEQ